jgi:hypothetical protein
MRVEIEDDLITARYCAVPRPHEPPATPPRVADFPSSSRLSPGSVT